MENHLQSIVDEEIIHEFSHEGSSMKDLTPFPLYSI